VVLNFTPDQALLILQAAQKQGIADDVKAWGCSTPCNSDFVADALGTVWDGKFGVNAELNLTSAPGPDSKLYRALATKTSCPSASAASARWASPSGASQLRRCST
jgi:branched-chain amino acid transport system substrate-binding protein